MLGEACELASIRWRGCEPVVEKTAAALHGARALPEELLLISEAQYADRESWNAKFGRWEPLPPPRDPARPIHWVEAADLDGEPVWLPAAYCLSGFELGYHEFAIADSNGCASGPTRDWAIRAAFLELSERDAVARWWHAGESRPGLEPERLIEAGRGGELLRWIRDRPRSLEVLDLSLDGEAIAFAAVSYDEKGRDVALGFGACFQPEVALEAALLELLQCELMMWAASQSSIERESAVSVWRDRVTVHGCPWLRAIGSSKITRSKATAPAGELAGARRALEIRGSARSSWISLDLISGYRRCEWLCLECGH